MADERDISDLAGKIDRLAEQVSAMGERLARLERRPEQPVGSQSSESQSSESQSSASSAFGPSEMPAPPEVPSPPQVPPPPEVPPPAILVTPPPQQPEPEVRPFPPPSFGQAAEKPAAAARPAEPPNQGPEQPISWQTQLERLIGGRAAIWASAVAIFLGVALLLRYTFPHVNVAGRVFGGMAFGVALLAAGAWSRDRHERWFSAALNGMGLAILYVSVWAGASLYRLIPNPVAFPAMMLVTAVGVLLSVRYDSLSLIVLSTLGGFLTPAVIGAGERGASDPLPFLLYVAVLNAGILAVSFFRRWRSVVLLSFAATVLLVGGWADMHYAESVRWLLFGFATLYFLLFVGAACGFSLIRKEETASSDLLLLFSDALVYAAAGYALVKQPLGVYPGLFPVALAAFLGAVAAVVRSLAPGNFALRRSAIGLCLGFITLAVPAQMKQGWLGSAWSVEAAVLAWLGYAGRDRLLKSGAQVVWLLGLLAALWEISIGWVSGAPLFLNNRAVPVLFWAAASAWMAWLGHGRHPEQRDQMTDAAGIAAVFAAAWLLAQETHLGFSRVAGRYPVDWQSRTMFLVGMEWAALGAAALWVGYRLRFPAVRLAASLAALCAAAMPLLGSTVGDLRGWAPFWNLRFLSFAVVFGLTALCARMLSREQDPRDTAALSGSMPVIASLLVLVGMSLEVYGAVVTWWRGPASEAGAAAMLVTAAVWGIYCAGLITLARQWRNAALRTLAAVVGILAGLIAVVVSLETAYWGWTPISNLRLASFAVAAAALAFAARPSGAEGEAAERDVAEALSAVAAAMLVVGISVELHSWFRQQMRTWPAAWEPLWLFATSAWWGLSGIACTAYGRLRGLRALWVFGYVALCAGVFVVAAQGAESAGMGMLPVANVRFVAFLAVSAALAASLRYADWPLRSAPGSTESTRIWPGTLGLGAILLLLLGISVETWDGVFHFRKLLTDWRVAAMMFLSLAWALYGFALWLAGVAKGHQPLRLVALGLLTLTTAKVFLLDLSWLDTPYRIVSFLGLGLILLWVSVRYSRSGTPPWLKA